MRLLASILLAMIPAAATAECVVRSGPTTNVLVELYTSEGCDSCPPADRWLSRVVGGGTPSDRVIPVAFHVDYWDYLGWKDRFGQALFSDRQRALARAANTTRVYTPQVMIGGRDFGAWRDEAQVSASFDALARKPARAAITITTQPPSKGKLLASVEAQAMGTQSPENLAVHLALVENGLASRVTSGENRGETLRHDAVVRTLSATRGPGLSYASVVTVDPAWNLANQSWVAFVQDLRTGEVLQALRSPACRS